MKRHSFSYQERKCFFKSVYILLMWLGRADGRSRHQYQLRLNTIACFSQTVLYSLIKRCWHCWSHREPLECEGSITLQLHISGLIMAAPTFGLPLRAVPVQITFLQAWGRRAAEGRPLGLLVNRLLLLGAPWVTPAVPDSNIFSPQTYTSLPRLTVRLKAAGT